MSLRHLWRKGFSPSGCGSLWRSSSCSSFACPHSSVFHCRIWVYSNFHSLDQSPLDSNLPIFDPINLPLSEGRKNVRFGRLHFRSGRNCRRRWIENDKGTLRDDQRPVWILQKCRLFVFRLQVESQKLGVQRAAFFRQIGTFLDGLPLRVRNRLRKATK